MLRLAVLLVLALAACRNEPAATGTVDERVPVGVLYVGAPELNVREQPNDTAPILATYQNGEAVSILVDKGEWVEVRTGDRAGWARKADLGTATAKAADEENPQPKFRIMPLPVSAPSAHGEIYIEADVNSDGEVVATRLIVNSTGSPALAAQNEGALRYAKFYPIIRKNQRQPFKYYHRVTY
jgi:uncharacterized protein YgiM (DUF1202 family)